MASAARDSIRHREAGGRKSGKHRGKSVDSTMFGINDLGLSRWNISQVYAIERMYNTHPAVQAARTVLHAQLFSGGISLYRDGKAQKVSKEMTDVQKRAKQVQSNAAASSTASSSSSSSNPTRAPSESGGDADVNGVKETFNQHLQTHWLSFARDVCDCFIKFGICPVIFELEEEDRVKRAARLAKQSEGISGPSRKRPADAVSKRLIPKVPQLGSYEVSYENYGRFGYTRRYGIMAQVPGQTLQDDEEAVLFVNQHLDSSGNVNSPMASVFELGSFVHSITELAMVAEISRATPQIVTQLRPPQKSAGLDPGALFFDSESRNVQSGQDTEESQSAARALEMQAHLCKIINSLQTTNRDASAPGGSSAAAYQPPDIQPKLFCVPKDQELIPNANRPEARNDLESLQRLAIDQIGAALGVPASLIFEGKFSGKSTQQLQLLNSTISQLAKAINDVLTKTYLSLYPDEAINSISGLREEVGSTNLELRLRTAPLSASEEIVSLFGAQLIDSEVAVPAALHALGASNDEIEAALERIRAKEEKQCECDDQDRDMEVQQKKVSLETAKFNLKNAKENPQPASSSSSSPSSSSSAPKETKKPKSSSSSSSGSS